MTPEQNFAVMHLDLDKFKQINDTLGHGAGDAVLTHVATVIDRQIGELGLTCRVGGDEFVVLFETAPSTKMAEKICSEIISTLEEPFHHDGHTCRFSVSIGYATGAGDCDEKMDVFGHADAALYAAKEAGRGCFRFHGHTTTPNFLSEADERQRLLDAIASGELTCHYQPQFHAVSGDLVGAEALVRWKCPQRGLLRPDAFMPTVEKFELEGMVDGHVFDLVARSQTLWAKSGAPQLPISMNISRQRFQCRKMLDHVSSNLKKHHRIHFELLETAFWDKLNDRDMQTLETLRQLGIGIELDDFGSGHASIAAMQAVQPDRIKIDGKLVVPITSNSEQILVLKLVTKLARLQKVGVVVEGVETLEHLKMVKDLDCDVLQGYALGMPMEADEFFCLLMGAPASQAQLRANG
jgi:diguanylate cyclase (GGDEF)-like protein